MDKKILIQIPCYNEEDQIENTIQVINEECKDFFSYDILIINDGSTDSTLEKIKKIKNIKILSFKNNKGLGQVFKAGLEYAKINSYDCLVNFDADNQYPANRIKDLIHPIINENVDIVIGSRDFKKITHFSKFKVFLQIFGSKVVNLLSGLNIKDVTTGFRSYSSNAINQLFVDSKFSYTHEILIQSYDIDLVINEILIETNPKTRNSRLFKTNFHFIYKQLIIIFKCFSVYRPFNFFFLLSLPSLVAGIVLVVRFLINYFINGGAGLIQSLTIGSMCILITLILISLGLIGEIIKYHKKSLIFFLKKNNK